MEEVVRNATKSQVEITLGKELEELESLSVSSCIYKVPKILRNAKKEAYKPKVISIGPYHCGSKKLHAMHSLKKRYLQSFLKRTGLELGTYVKMALGWEGKVRGYYDEECGLDSDKLVRMILIDGIFIVEFTMQYDEGENIDLDASLIEDIKHDLMLLENQLPFFVLKDLYDLSFLDKTHSWIRHSVIFIRLFDAFWTAEMAHKSTLAYLSNLLENADASDIKHLVDLIHYVWVTMNSKPIFMTLRKPKLELPCSATELQEAGVKLSVRKSNTTDIVVENRAAENRGHSDLDMCIGLAPYVLRLFGLGKSVATGGVENRDVENGVVEKNGVLLIPRFVVKRNTESLFRNIIAYEQCHRKTPIFRSYVILMDCLINTSQDVDLLVSLGIIENSLGETEDVCTLFNNLYKMPMMDSREFIYADLCGDLNKYSRDPWHKWKATWFRWKLILGRDYFSNPWSIISVIAAFILLSLTIIQTVCSIKGVKW